MEDASQLKKLRLRSGGRGDAGQPSLARDALERLPVAVAVALQRDDALEPKLTHGNRAFAELIGRDLALSLPCKLTDFVALPHADQREKRLGKGFSSGQAVKESLTIFGPDGTQSDVVCEWTPLATPSQDGRYWTVTLTPYSGDEELRKALWESEDRLAAIFRYAPVDICLKDHEGRYVQVSRRFEELYNVTNEEVKGKLPADIGVDDAWAEMVRSMDLEVLESRQARVFEETIPLKSSAFEGLTVKFPLIDSRGELQGIGTICTDVTERKLTERALIRSELEATRSRTLLSEAIESMTDGFVWFSAEGRLLLCNSKYRDLFPKLANDFRPGAFYSDLMRLAFERDQLTVLSGDPSDALDGNNPELAQKYPSFRTKTSEGRWIEARNHPLQAGGFIGIRFDVTDQVMAEDALKESEQRFKDFAQSGPGGFWEMDESLRFSSFLDVQRTAGRSRPTAAEATGRTLWELFDADVEADRYWQSFQSDLKARRPIDNLRASYVSAEGDRYYWRINGKPYFDRTGRFCGYRGVAEDETAEVMARQRAEEAEARLIDAIESISGGFALFDADDRLVLCNQTYRQRAGTMGVFVQPGISFEEILHRNIDSGCVVGLDGEEDRAAWVQSRLAAHQVARGAFEIAWHDGRTYLMTERRTRDGGIASVSTDITELKRARETAEQANQAKTRFLAAASHDLRQPLHAIELFVAALEATVDDEEAHGIIGDLREASNAAGRLLNALLDVSELESGKLEGRIVHFPVQQLFDRMLRVYGPQARERGLQLKVVPSSHIIFSDPNLLERILGNLLSNAVRYTPSGRILLGCRRRRSKLRIEVWDTGQGIPEGEQRRIFEEFHQLENPARERRRGAGLGLAIVRRLANILGHEIFLHSVRGHGSVFSVQLDLTGKSMSLADQQQRSRLTGCLGSDTMILVIDDDLQVRKGTVRALESWGCTVAAAENYDDAAEIVAESPDAFDLIVADYRLPNGCNGVRAAGRLRALCGRMLPVLIVTADQGEEELQEISGQGFQTLQKPVDPVALQSAVVKLLAAPSVSAANDGAR
jgi:PAS domain S-box-containing protein